MDTIPYYSIKRGALEQISVNDVAKQYNNPSYNTAQLTLELQLGAQYQLIALLQPKKATKATPKKTVPETKASRKSTVKK